MRRAAKRDANEKPIVDALEAAGCTIARLNGRGVPDLLVGRLGRLWLLEVKDGAKVRSKQKLTQDQEQFHQRWAGSPIRIIRSVDEALAWLLLSHEL